MKKISKPAGVIIASILFTYLLHLCQLLQGFDSFLSLIDKLFPPHTPASPVSEIAMQPQRNPKSKTLPVNFPKNVQEDINTASSPSVGETPHVRNFPQERNEILEKYANDLCRAKVFAQVGDVRQAFGIYYKVSTAISGLELPGVDKSKLARAYTCYQSSNIAAAVNEYLAAFAGATKCNLNS